jgi:hypothetical protein
MSDSMVFQESESYHTYLLAPNPGRLLNYTALKSEPFVWQGPGKPDDMFLATG